MQRRLNPDTVVMRLLIDQAPFKERSTSTNRTRNAVGKYDDEPCE